MKRIIIVEDDQSILDPMTIILRNAGYGVTIYLDGNLILNNDFIVPDIFIIDKKLPGADGLDICRHLKRQDMTKHIPVIMVSASSDIEVLAREAMADDVLEKPFKMNALRGMVAKHLTG
jgi:DNA-binding response OmpR family regulator